MVDEVLRSAHLKLKIFGYEKNIFEASFTFTNHKRITQYMGGGRIIRGNDVNIGMMNLPSASFSSI